MRACRPQATCKVTLEGYMSGSKTVVVGVGAELGLGAALCRRFAQGRFAQGNYHVGVVTSSK